MSDTNLQPRRVSSPHVFAADVHPARYAHGHAVVECGETDNGSAVAIWNVSIEGAASGAWQFSETDACTDPVLARQVLARVERRSILSTTPVTIGELLTKIAHAAGLALHATYWRKLDLRGAVEEVRDLRQEYLDGIRDQRNRTRSELVIPEFTWSPPDDLPDDVDALAEALGVAQPLDVPALSARALRLARTLIRIIGAWQEAEKVKAQRPYLLDAFGPVVPLPPQWHATVLAAYAAPLPL